jgi:hypothetical protein
LFRPPVFFLRYTTGKNSFRNGSIEVTPPVALHRQIGRAFYGVTHRRTATLRVQMLEFVLFM